MAPGQPSNNTTLEVEKHSSHEAPESSCAEVNTVSPTMDCKPDSNVKDSLEREEKGVTVGHGSAESGSVSEQRKSRFRSLCRRYKFVLHVFIWLFFTGWFVAGVVLHRKDLGWLIPFLLYLCITIRLVTFYIPITVVTKPMHFVWDNTGVKVANLVPERLRIWCGAAITISVIVIGSFASPESAGNTRANRAISLFGLVVLVGVLWATSANRRAIQWHTVIVGMLIQFLVALFVLRTKVGYDIFDFVSYLARSLLHFAAAGVKFLTTEEISQYQFFFFSVIPAIIFFISLTSLLFYCGALQWFIGKFAVFFFWSMRVSGAEAVVASASPFIGQGESIMLIKPFVSHLTQAEIHQVMASGFATIAGSVLVAYISMGVNAQALISSCVMSIPASLATSKLRYPETEESLTRGRVVIPDEDEDRPKNALQAFADGAWLGIKIAGMIMATLLCIIAFLALCNGILGWWGRYLNIPNLTIEQIVGYLCYPIAFLLGVPRGPDLYKVAKLIGVKLIANEFVAFQMLTGEKEYKDMASRSKLIATFALCSFANIGSLGTQIGVLSQIAPSRGGDVAKLAVSALITGALSTFSSAGIAGMIITDEANYISGSSA
ncbi:hypothetical protein AOL_s00193g13 [Orbilia oligospora ATCC 24927]|uniref:Concentrative nucleoside transporter C-terminal domain-containing protein n=2 Tax=Orbilia oligospora TaxID=2813651 RepID=G1XR14_ARTOA|nr:hypothetical protein AOL_s00193g13 [Orbilia oligospora ATCC 24927]EGX44285.1 hypothetical protein AOL_s00193g13 [Orbilia oligospora ATCC 24927]KAF3271016.1 hypothetical protein TWF970_010646 [Orbilia oligospora]